jgi:membrane-associated protease RseP (regulator of RpoE activity)
MTTNNSANQGPNGSAFERFVASNAGRVARIVLGVSLLTSGLSLFDRPAGLAVAAIGLVPLLTGALNLCPVAPLWGGHFLGARYCPARQTRRAMI